MTQLKHTPGPWSLDKPRAWNKMHISEDYHFIDAAHGYLDSESNSGFGIAGLMSLADAQLITSAPELLESLILAKSVIKNLADDSNSKISVLEIIDAAISKATNVECLL